MAPSYLLTLMAFSNDQYIDCTMDVTVLWANRPPTLHVGRARNVTEDAAVNDFVSDLTVTATDPDTTQMLTFSILAASPSSGPTLAHRGLDIFGIGSCTGLIYIKALGMEFLEVKSYKLTIQVSDNFVGRNGTLTDTQQLEINVIHVNHEPSFAVTSSQVKCSVYESSAGNTAITGANCNSFTNYNGASIPWTDPDTPLGDYVTWSIR